MKSIMYLIAVMSVLLFVCGVSYPAGNDDEGGFKFRLDSLPFFNDSKEEPDRPPVVEDDYTDEEKYRVDATGRKVPVRTEKSGSASPL